MEECLQRYLGSVPDLDLGKLMEEIRKSMIGNFKKLFQRIVRSTTTRLCKSGHQGCIAKLNDVASRLLAPNWLWKEGVQCL